MSRRIITVTPSGGLFESVREVDPQLCFDFEVITDTPQGWFGRTTVKGVGKFLSKNNYKVQQERWVQ